MQQAIPELRPMAELLLLKPPFAFVHLKGGQQIEVEWGDEQQDFVYFKSSERVDLSDGIGWLLPRDFGLPRS